MNETSIFYPEGILLAQQRGLTEPRTLQYLQEARATERILEARAAICDSDHNLVVDLGCMRGIIPRAECALGIQDGSVKDIAIISRVNKPVCFQIIEFQQDERGRQFAILSRRKAQQRCMDQYIRQLRPGDIINCKVTHMEQFGCFVDIGCGIPSMIPIDMISVSRISHPADRFHVGDMIRAVVCGVEANGRVMLSHKELLGTWEENAALFHPGETVAGIVRSVEDYGVFVELTPNLAGLAEFREGVREGQQASIYIKSMIPEKMKVKLIIIDAFDAVYERERPTYFVQENHIDSFRYSPACCDKVIETRFDTAT